MVGEEAAYSRVYEEGIRLLLAIFYAGDGYISSRNELQLQEAMDSLTALFDHVGLRTNTDKTKSMTCLPGKVRTRLLDEVYTRMKAGFLTQDEWDQRRVQCDTCGKDLSAASLGDHLESQHDIYQSKVINKSLVIDGPPRTFNCEPNVAGCFHCPVPGCVGEATTKWNMRRHFVDRHPNDFVSLPGEGAYSKCELCGMQTSPFAAAHEQSNLCKQGAARKTQRDAAQESELALREVFQAYGEELERVEVFKYLGRLVSMDDNDVQAVRSNLKKARKCWARISRVLRAENASPRVCGMFYKATVQAVLLYGSETWNLTPSAMKKLEGFHIRSAYRMARDNKPQCDPLTKDWTYPLSKDVLEEVGLFTIEHYIEVRRQTICNYIVDRPIFSHCMDGVRKRGTSPRQWWWEQSMDLDAARASASVDAAEADSDVE